MFKLVEASAYLGGAILLGIALAGPLLGESPLARFVADVSPGQFQWVLTGGSILFLLVTASAAALLGGPRELLRRMRRR